MKLAGREAIRFCARPELSNLGVLLHGPDSGLIAAKRRALITTAMDGAIDDMRLTDLDAADARKDAAQIDEALRARGFFPGRRVVTIQGGTDGLAKPLATVLPAITQDDALLVVTADALPARSALRKLFEGHKQLMSLQFFEATLEPEDVRTALAQAGLQQGITDAGLGALLEMLQTLDHGSGLQLIGTVALYGLEAPGPLEATDVRAIAPLGSDADIDRFIDAAASGRPEEIGPLLRRLATSGVQPVTLVIALQRHFRQLVRILSDGGSVDQAIAAIRPPVWGPRRQALSTQARRWSATRVEQAARMLFETDGRIRSSGQLPDMALLERCGLRLAMMAGR